MVRFWEDFLQEEPERDGEILINSASHIACAKKPSIILVSRVTCHMDEEP